MPDYPAKEMVVDDAAVVGLLGWFGTPWVLENLHRHSDIEINLIVRGEMRSLIGGQVQTLRSGELSVFWAVTPHRITHCDEQTLLGLVHVPLLEFLRWNMPAALRDALLRGQLLQYAAELPFDELLFRRWAGDLQETPVPTPTLNPQEHEVVLLEVQARLRRLAKMVTARPLSQMTPPPAASLSKAEQLASLLAERHTDPVELGTLARAAGLHPNYAMTLFREAFGMTMLQYLTQHRVAHAQRLLITTDLEVLDIAMEAGFGSVGHFYNLFKRSSGVSPRRYRALHQGSQLAP